MVYLIVIYLIIGMSLYYKEYLAMNKTTPNMWVLKVKREYDCYIKEYGSHGIPDPKDFENHMIAVETILSALLWPMGVVGKFMKGE